MSKINFNYHEWDKDVDNVYCDNYYDYSRDVSQIIYLNTTKSPFERLLVVLDTGTVVFCDQDGVHSSGGRILFFRKKSVWVNLYLNKHDKVQTGIHNFPSKEKALEMVECTMKEESQFKKYLKTIEVEL